MPSPSAPAPGAAPEPPKSSDVVTIEVPERRSGQERRTRWQPSHGWRSRDILRAIFFPDEQVNPKYRTTVLTMRDKSVRRGLVVSEDAQTLVLKTAEAAEPVTLQKVEIASRTTDNDSIMPANLPDLVGDGNLAHVAAFLMSGQ